MKRIIIISLLVSFLFSCEKEVSEKQSDYFIKMYGNYQLDEGFDMQQTVDGGLIIVGSSERTNTGKDIIMIKVDKYGNEASWSPRYFGGEDDDAGYCVKSISGGYVICGSTTVEDANGDKNLDAIIFKTDTEGNIIGESKTFGGDYDDEAFCIVEKQSGGFMFVGYTSTSFTESELFVGRVDERLGNFDDSQSVTYNGKILKVRNIGASSYLAMGNKYSGGTGSEVDYFYVPINEDGNYSDYILFDEEDGNETFSSFIVNNTDEIHMVGTLSSLSGANGKILVNKIQNRMVVSSFSINEDGTFEGKDIAITKDGGYAILGTRTLAGDKNIILYFTDANGKVLSSKIFGASGDQIAESFIYGENEIIILGRNSYESNSMITIIKTDLEGNLWE